MMATKGKITELYDIAAIEIQHQKIIGHVNELLQAINRIKPVSFNVEGSEDIATVLKGMKEIVATSKEVSEVNKNATRSSVELANARKAEAGITTELTQNNARLSKSLEELNLLYAQNRRSIDELRRSKKDLDNQYKNGIISQEQYEKSLADIVQKENALKIANAEILKGLKAMEKEMQSGAGSLNQLKAKLDLATQAFDRLSAAERNSTSGKLLNSNINALTKQILVLEEDTDRHQRKVGNYERALKGLGSTVQTLAGAYLGLAGVQKIFDFLSDSVKEFNEAQDIAARLENTLNNVGRSDAMERLRKSAENLANEFKTIDDDDVIGVFDQLITFGKLTENQINQLLPVIINFAAKQRISLADSASVIIKALEGNGKALKEYGINMKDASGTTEAFGLIMSQVAPKVEGVAKAFGETTQGQIKATRVEIDNLKESIGEQLQPLVGGFYEGVQGLIIGIKQFFSRVGDGFNSLVTDFSKGLRTLKDLATFNFSDIHEMAEEQERIKKNQEDMARAHRDRAAAQSLADDVVKKSEKEQNEILLQNKALLSASYAEYQKFIKAGTISSKEGREAARVYFADMQKVLKIEEAIRISRDKTVLGSGSPTGGSKSETTLQPVAKKFDDHDLKVEQDKQQKLSEILTLSLQTRINAREKAADIERQIIEGSRDVELQNEIEKFNAIKNKRKC